jgi:hypothetical protein
MEKAAMTQRQVKAIFDELRAKYRNDDDGVDVQVMVDLTIYLNSVGEAFTGLASYDATTGLLVVNGDTFVRCEQISALVVREVQATST